MWLVIAPIIAPLLIAALLSALSDWLPRRWIDSLATLTAGGVMAACGVLAWVSYHRGPIVYWLGDWKPVKNFPLGISLVVEPMGAGLATLASLLMLCAFVFAWSYFDSVKSLFHAVMLVFLAAMCGLCLTGDLFNLFVWFELMSATGVTLCGYHSDEFGPLQGSLNFAVTNTLGAYLTLTGIAVLYAQTGALNMAQVGASLKLGPANSTFVLISFVFLISGFLVKAAAFPFHFWLDDAHAVAPTPVCILFSGVMVELGLYAVVRIYWTVFSITLQPYVSSLRHLFLTVGILTACVGAFQSFNQRHLKRLLAFSTISHVGIMIVGFALLDRQSLAGTALYVLGHGMIKGALFICAGILLSTFESVDEFELQGAGRALPWTGFLMLVGALGLTSVPPFGNFFGEARIDLTLEAYHLPWVSPILALASAFTAAAVLRAACRVFLGWGEGDQNAKPEGRRIPMKKESRGKTIGTPFTMFVPAAVLLAMALMLPVLSGAQQSIQHAADMMQDTRANHAAVLQGSSWSQPFAFDSPHLYGHVWSNVLALFFALALAAWGLYPRALGRTGRQIVKIASIIEKPLGSIHTGRIGDYIAWFVFGIAAYAGFLLLSVR